MGASLVRVLRDAGATRVTSVGGEAELRRRLDCGHIPDRWPGEGPLGGACTALGALSDHDHAWVVAGDLPGLQTGTLHRLRVHLESSPDSLVAVALSPRGPEPLVACWRTAAAQVLEGWFVSGERSLTPVLDALDPVMVRVEESEVANVNTAADLDLVSPPALDTLRWMDVPQIDVAQLAERKGRGELLIDVREPSEYLEGHVDGAVLIPLAEVGSRLDEIPEQEPVMLICRSGGRSQKACELLRRVGRDAHNVAGGTLAWLEAGLPVVRGT